MEAVAAVKSIAEIVTLASRTCDICVQASNTKKSLKIIGVKVQNLSRLLQGLPKAYSSKQEVREWVKETVLDMNKVEELATRVKKMNRAVYLVCSSSINKELSTILDSIRLNLESLQIAGQSDMIDKLENMNGVTMANNRALSIALREEQRQKAELMDLVRQTQQQGYDGVVNVRRLHDMAGIESNEELCNIIQDLVDEQDALQAHLLQNADAKLQNERHYLAQITEALQNGTISDKDGLVNADGRLLPGWCYCPISSDPMNDPVQVDCPNFQCCVTIDRASAESWVKDHNHSDCLICRIPLRSKNLRSNPALKQAIQQQRQLFPDQKPKHQGKQPMNAGKHREEGLTELLGIKNLLKISEYQSVEIIVDDR